MLESIDCLTNDSIGKIENLSWMPWIGKNYSKSNPKLMIVGESHYKWENEDGPEAIEGYLKSPEFTKDVLKAHVENRDEKKIFENIEKTLLQEAETSGSRQSLWDSVVFYNFIQRYMENKTIRPVSEDFVVGWKVFFDVLQLTRPKYCLFCGVESSNEYGAFKAAIGNGEFQVVEEKRNEAQIGNTSPRIIEIEDKDKNRIKLIFIRHPSSYFSWEEWGKFISSQIVEGVGF